MTVLLMSESETEEKVTRENVTDVVSPDHAQHLRLLEALVFAGTQALDEQELADRLPNDADVKRLLATVSPVGVSLTVSAWLSAPLILLLIVTIAGLIAAGIRHD
jgi:hypothetical protein